MQKKSAAIKVRVDPITKSVLVQIAEEELLDLSDIVRHALKDYVRKKSGIQVQVSDPRTPQNVER